ncbi:ABC transporter permease [Verrucomicrobiota bacterium]|nr:probable ABC transporter permease protein slr1045 [Verrucomicrobiota bacterium]GDY17525.1 ABC transporter permease [Verrucomicrobiota bacterium]
MSHAPASPPRARTEVLADGTTVITLGGDWNRQAATPAIAFKGDQVRLVTEQLGDFDSSLPGWIHAHFRQVRRLDLSALPSRLRSLVELAEQSTTTPSPETTGGLLARFGGWGLESSSSWGRAFEHIGDVALGLGRLLIGRARVNWQDFWLQLQTAGVDALPIVALLGFLTGLIMAYVGLIQLRQVGATVYVANLVSLAMTREMGALMTGVIACGRTATSFASQLGSMNVSQETDALRVLGINPVEYLGLPRILAVTLMVPLLSVFATFIGVFGGMIVACAGDLSVSQYLTQVVVAISFRSFLVGFIKSIAFGFIAAWAGCYRGAVAKPSALGVGEAATSAAVLGITLIVISDALFAVIFNLFNF